MDRESILQKIKSEIEALASDELKDKDEEIFKTDFLDSLNVINIITFIEGEFGLSVDTFDLTIDSLGTLNKITDYVVSKLEA